MNNQQGSQYPHQPQYPQQPNYQQPPPQYPQYPQQPQYPQGPPSPKNNTVMIILISLIVLAVLGGGFFAYKSMSKDDKAPAAYAANATAPSNDANAGMNNVTPQQPVQNSTPPPTTNTTSQQSAPQSTEPDIENVRQEAANLASGTWSYYNKDEMVTETFRFGAPRIEDGKVVGILQYSSPRTSSGICATEIKYRYTMTKLGSFKWTIQSETCDGSIAETQGRTGTESYKFSNGGQTVTLTGKITSGGMLKSVSKICTR